MYTILMKDDKSLITTVRNTLYQGENLVDKIQILCPEFYEDLDLKKCTVYLRYIDQGNILHNETLQKDTELYNGKIRFVLPVNTELTRFAGIIYISIVFSYYDNETKSTYFLNSGEAKIEISPVSVKFQISFNIPDNDENNDTNGDSNTDNPDLDKDDEDGFDSVEF